MLNFVKTRRLGMFYRSLSAVLASGISIIEAMDIMAGHKDSFQQVVLRMKQLLAQGSSLGEVFAQFPHTFPEWHIQFIKYNEKAGSLAVGFGRLADFMEKEYSIQQTMIGGLAYPVALLHIGLFLFPVIGSFSGCGFNLIAYLLGFLKMVIPLYGGFFLLYFLVKFLNSSSHKLGFHNFLISFPGLGSLIRQFSVTRFIRALQCLCASGVGIISAWRMSADACGNEAVREALLRGVALLEQGELLSKAFIKTQLFSSDTIGMIVAAEKSGSIAQMLNTIATYSEKQNEAAMNVVVKVLPIFVYLAVAAFIAFKIVSFYLGYFGQIFSMTGGL